MGIKSWIGVLAMALIFGGCSSSAKTERQKRIEASPNWGGEAFLNPEYNGEIGFGHYWEIALELYFNKPPGGEADPKLPAQKLDWAAWPEQEGLQLAWLGHTTYLIRLEGKWLITDPMLSNRAGPVPWLSPERYSEAATEADELPPMDVVLITHNHYDHLDQASIQALAGEAKRFLVPLGVGELLEKWGVAPEKITEMDWWDEVNFAGLKLTATPAQHFSSRGLFDRGLTLWSGYAIKGAAQNLYLSGDTGYFKDLSQIGKRLGPFDVGIYEMGAYGKFDGWKQIHLTPEEAVQAHRDIGAKVMIPSHWGTFDLALFAWHEPIERFVSEAEAKGIAFLTPKIGERLNPGHVGGQSRWWRPFIPKE